MDAASLGQNDQLAPAVLVLMLLLSVLRAAAARIQQAPSPMRAAAASSHTPHAVRQPAPRPELPQLPPLPRPSRRPHAAPREPASPSARSAAPRSRSSEPRRRRGVVPLLLRPVAWVARVALSPVGVLGAVRVACTTVVAGARPLTRILVSQAGGAALYLHQRPEERARLERAARAQVQRGEALVRGMGVALPRRQKRASAPSEPAPGAGATAAPGRDAPGDAGAQAASGEQALLPG
jgi:hypothetical protein